MLWQLVGSVSSAGPGFAGADFLWLVLKWMFLLAFGMYVVFAFVVTRQVTVMKNTLMTSFTPLLKLASYLLLALSIVVFIFFFIIL